MFFAHAKVQEAFQTMLALAVVLQLVPFLYMFAALLKLAAKADGQGHYSKPVLLFAGISGLVTTTLGIVLVFFPAQQIVSVWAYELKMVAGTVFFIGIAWFLFFVYGARKHRAAEQLVTRA